MGLHEETKPVDPVMSPGEHAMPIEDQTDTKLAKDNAMPPPPIDDPALKHAGIPGEKPIKKGKARSPLDKLLRAGDKHKQRGKAGFKGTKRPIKKSAEALDELAKADREMDEV